MSFLIDSADRDLIADLWPSAVFTGVTTNPTILSRAGLTDRDVPALYRWLVESGVDRIYVQARGRSADELRVSATQIRSLGPVVVKIPATAAGFAVSRELVSDGAEVLLTAVYHPVQAVIARDLGIQGVAPYVGRMTDAGRDGVAAVAAMQRAIGSAPTRILAASLRSVDDVGTLAAAGVPDFTVGAAVARAMVADPLTLAAVEEFEAAAGG